MRLAREIAEEFFKDWSDEDGGVATGLSAGILAHIIAANLEPMRDVLRKISTVYDWHPQIPDDGRVGEGLALEDVIDLARSGFAMLSEDSP